MSNLVVPAWGRASAPLLPSIVRGWLANQPAPTCIAAWLGRRVVCGELDSYIWASSLSPLDSACLREVADLVSPLLEPLAQLRPLPPIRSLGPLVAGLPLRTRTVNALRREGLLEPEGALEARTLAELADIRNFGTMSLLDLLCVVESALNAITIDAAAGIAGTAPDIITVALGAWGTRGVPIIPSLFRALLDGEPASPAVQRWLADSTVTLDQLDEQIWAKAANPPPHDLLPEVAASVVPAIRRAGSMQPFPLKPLLGPVLAALPLRARTMNTMSAAGYLDQQSRVEEATIDQLMQIPNFGAANLVDLLCVAEAALPKLGHPAMPSFVNDIQGKAARERDIRIIAAWAVGEHGAETAGKVLELSNVPRPQEVEVAWQHILQFPLRDLAGDQAQRYSPPDVIAQFMSSLDDREIDVLRDRILPINSVATLDELARRHGLSRERVRQIEVRIKDRLTTLADSSVGRLAITLSQRLGTAAPTLSQDVTAVAANLVDQHSDPTLSGLLVLYLAGPYRADDGWILRIPSRASLEGTRYALIGAADQSGIVSDAAVTDVLDRAGIRHHWHDAWISRLGCLKRVGDKYLRWDGTTLDRLERLLRLRGKPATTEELLADLGETPNSRGIKYRLMEDPRFIRINKQSQFALPEWGFDEYTGITDEIAREIERRGGAADADYLVLTISSTYGVAEASVRAYLAAPMFVRSDSGTIRLRGDKDGTIPMDVDLSDAADCCLSPVGWCLRVPVDEDVLRGSGRAISAAFGVHVGVEPGNKITIPGPESAITVSWPVTSITGPSVGSLRAEALALDALPGDLLFLVYAADQGRFYTKLVRASDIEATDGLSRLALLHGLQPADDPKETLIAIAHALGVKTTEANNLSAIIDMTLTRRRQDSWRQFLPPPDQSESLDDVIERLTKALG